MKISLAWTNWDFKHLAKAGFSAILIILGASLVENNFIHDTTTIYVANALIGLGVVLGFLTSKNLKDRIDKLEEFFGINTLESTTHKNKKQNESKDNQTKLQSSIMIISTATIAVFTVVLAIVTIYQYNIENFEPRVDMTNGMITIIPGVYTFYNNTYGISISATTNHNLKFTVVNASMVDINNPYAKCFFSTLPTIRSFDQTSIIFGKNADVKTLVPSVALDYATNSTFWFSSSIPSTPENYQLAEIKFNILMEDLQDESKNRMKEASSDIVVKLPHQQYDKLISNCTSVQKHIK